MPPTSSASDGSFTITLFGDLMLGRLIDQLLPSHVSNSSDASTTAQFTRANPSLQSYTWTSPWGNTMPLLHASDLVLGNLETAVTTHDVPWPDKVFNYRMHPDNVRCLTEARVDCVSLANNHSLDFGVEGLVETVDVLKRAGVGFVGVGETAEEAGRVKVLSLRRRNGEVEQDEKQIHDDEDAKGEQEQEEEEEGYKLHLYAFSDHPSDWHPLPQFNSLTYTPSSRSTLQSTLTSHTTPSDPPCLKIVSIHWGPNYTRHPSSEIQSLAHFLIDSCGVDLIWGHSSHHIQGVEVYKSKLIVYGCGDFIDDYAVNQEFRSDLGAVWNVVVEEMGGEGQSGKDGGGRLRVKRLEVHPTRIERFQTNLLEKEDRDYEWVCGRFRELCVELGTRVEDGFGQQGQIVVEVDGQ